MNPIVDNFIKQLKYYKDLADKSIEQVASEDLFFLPSSESNSIAIIMKHIAGNMLSRWTDIFSSDGEKEWRNRDQEFIVDHKDVQALKEYWESGWHKLFETLESLSDKDLDKIIYIRNMGHTVREAIVRQVCHYPYHIGQIVFIAKMIANESFQSLSVPKGKSVEYNQEKFAKQKSRKHFTEDL